MIRVGLVRAILIMFGLGLAVGCGDDPPKKPFMFPKPTNTGDGDEGDGDGDEGDGDDGDGDSGDGDSGDGDSGDGDSGDGDSGDGDMDSGTGEDMDAGADASTDAGDAGAGDAGEESDASDGSSDASVDPDAGEPDSGSVEPACGEVKGANNTYLGNSCKFVVTCQDPADKEDDFIEACVLLENEEEKNRCCVGEENQEQTCRAADAVDQAPPTGVGKCDVEASCDGPEDCPEDASQCCMNNENLTGNAIGCSASCTKPTRTLCHKDADCPATHRCEAGFDHNFGIPVGTQRVALWWGFCHPK